MPNQNERPKYTDPDHPYSGSGPRYQNNYSRSEYHAGDGPFQFPWWAIVIGFVVWWPLGFIFIGLNTAMKNGKLGGFEEKARAAQDTGAQLIVIRRPAEQGETAEQILTHCKEMLQ